MIRIVLADDHAVLRDGLSRLLRGERDFQLLGEAANGFELQRLVATVSPDVVLTDLSMPGPGLPALLEDIRRHQRGTRVVTLTMHDDVVTARRTLDAGVAGYVLKSCPFAEVAQAIRQAAAGGRHVTQAVEDKLRETRTRSDVLTSRETEIVTLLAAGQSSKQIGQALGVSARTIDTHRTNMMRKLGLHSATELVRYAIDHGLVSGL
jgi:DNA-binding NarL/FixJ family response regulator